MSREYSVEEHRLAVFRFVQELTLETGIPIDAEEVWENVKQRTVKPVHGV